MKFGQEDLCANIISLLFPCWMQIFHCVLFLMDELVELGLSIFISLLLFGLFTVCLSHSIHNCRSVYEGSSASCILSNCQMNEGMVHTYRVACRNDIGMGPYSLPVHFTKTEACEFYRKKKEEKFPMKGTFCDVAKLGLVR